MTNKKNLILFLCLFIFILKINAQSNFNYSKDNYNIKPNKIIDDSQRRQCESASIIWENIQKSNSQNLSFTTPVEFTCFGVGLDLSRNDINCSELIVEYRVKGTNKEWSRWISTEFETSPEQNNPQLYWSELLFTPDATAYNEIEFKLTTPENTSIKTLRVDLMNIISSDKPIDYDNHQKLNGCPALPYVIPRSVWLEPYYGVQTYTPTIIYPTHVVMHHGASPDTYTDGAAVVRGYWNYHVNSNGWSDIGYNYLIDKYGNIYQGRKNSDIEGQDVRGAHAGASNDESIGVNFLGNADVTLPTTFQLAKQAELLGWWFDTRGYDPTTSANITLQSGGTGMEYRICGHKDVNVGGTACPGVTMYAQLPQMRLDAKAVIDACLSAPTTYVTVAGNWQTANFNSTFIDTADAGLSTAFYQPLDYNGTEWRANSDFGFFNDNFDNAIHPEWTNISGDWSINSGYLNQTNQDSSNTNLYADLVQTTGNIYLYHFSMKIGGSGANRRAGFHFFCDDPTLNQRNNSYMVYFRVDQNECQIYKAVNNSITIYTQDACTVAADTWYDYKITLNTTTGEIKAYQNDVLVSSWTDPAPFTVGNSVSLRTGNCDVFYNDFKVYRDRANAETVSIGSANDEIRYQNTSPSTPSCRVKSIIVDDNNNWSALEGTNVNIDWTPPSTSIVNDGSAVDIDTTYNNTQLTANWTAASDTNSGVTAYWYCIGDTPGNNNIADWTNNGLSTIVTRTGLSLNYNDTYYFTVRSVNGAGLISATDTSNGQLLLDNSTVAPIASFYAFDTLLVMPNAAAVFINTSAGASSYFWDFGDGSTSTDQNPWHQYAATGYYTVSLVAQSTTQPDDTLTLSNYIHVVNSTSVNEIANENLFNIYPNPFSEDINLEIHESVANIDISVSDIYGRKIFSENIESEKGIVSLSRIFAELSKGAYLIKIVAGDKVQTQLVEKL